MKPDIEETVRRIPTQLGVFMILFSLWMVVLFAASLWVRDCLRKLDERVKHVEQKCTR